MPPLHMWGEPDATSYRLRSRTYLRDRCKEASAPPLFHLVAVDVFAMPSPRERFDITGRKDNWVYTANARGAEDSRVGGGAAAVPYTFAVNVIIPSTNNLSLVAYFQPSEPGVLERRDQPEVGLFWRFVDGDDAFRSERFKMIPRVAKGPPVIRKGIGVIPVIIGKKMACRYYRRPNSFEVVIDVCSNMYGDYITRLVRDAMANSVCLDLAFTLEGKTDQVLRVAAASASIQCVSRLHLGRCMSAQELPERICGGVRCDHVDFRSCATELPPRADLL